MNTSRLQLVFHGSIILLVALACGLPSVVEVSDGMTRMWQAAHSALLIMGVWMFAQAGILALIRLQRTELLVLTWALIATSYSLGYAAIVQAITGTRALGPSTSLLGMSVFVANLVVVLGSVLVASLTLIGASNALKRARTVRENAASASASTV
jgi:hypothetical protein